MPSSELLTTEDINEIADSAFMADDPPSVAARLVAAVDAEELADPTDARHTLLLAAEILERADDLDGALALAGRAVAAGPSRADSESKYPWAYRGELLLRLGREDEGMAEFAALRPLLSRDLEAISPIIESLEDGGQTEIAEQWLTAALTTLLERRDRWRPGGGQAGITYILGQERYRLRRRLDLPYDELDGLADRLQEALFEDDDAPFDEDDEFDAYDELGGEGEDSSLLFWPQPEFVEVVTRWPGLAERYGTSWDDYRAKLQGVLHRLSELGVGDRALLAGSADEFTDYAADTDGDLSDSEICDEYAEYLDDRFMETLSLPEQRIVMWPPGRNDLCWCGSGRKYKKCCLPRSRR